MPKQYNVRDGRKVYPYSVILVSITDDFSSITTSQLTQTGALYNLEGWDGEGGSRGRIHMYAYG